MRRSHGPDKLKSGYACYLHHSGIRSFADYNNVAVGSGTHKILMDYDCCCDPCLYYKADFSASSQWGHPTRDPDYEHCCSCNPKVLVANWDPANTGDSCDIYAQKEPLFYDSYLYDGSTLSVRYAGTIANHPILVTLSPFQTNPDGTYTADGSGCRWTVHLASGTTFGGGYSSQVRFIDHNDVTCLNAPDVSFTGVTAFGGSGGIVTISNYDSSKAPFVMREIDHAIFTHQANPASPISGNGNPDYNGITGYYEYDPPNSGLIVPIPDKIISPALMHSGFNGFAGQYPTGVIPLVSDCRYVPRYLCVHSDREYDTPSLVNYSKYREYVYDTGFFPIERAEFDPAYTGINSFTTGKVLARWVYTPLGYNTATQVPSGEVQKFLFLYESYSHNVPAYSGSGALAQASGTPKFLLVPIEYALPSGGGQVHDNVWVGGGYYYHPLINGGSGVIAFDSAGEDYYYQPAGSTRNMYLGGNSTYGQVTYGSGDSYSTSISAFAGYSQDDYSDIRFIKSGICSKWKYLCSDACRCIPKHLCLLTAEVIRSPISTTITKHHLTWDGISCWVSNTGESGVSICLTNRSDIGFVGEETYNGLCGVTIGGGFFDSGVASYDYVFDEEYPVTCSWLSFGQSFVSNIEESGSTIASMIASTFPFFDDCDSRTACDIASPCRLNCGSHPDAINIYARAYSVAGEDEVSGGFTPTGVCTANFDLFYKEDIVISSEDPLSYYTLCYYEGYHGCESGIVPVRAYLNHEGASPFIEFDGYSDNTQLFSPYSKAGFTSYSESCEPYMFSGIMRETGPFNPFWRKYPCVGETSECQAFRLEIVITEV